MPVQVDRDGNSSNAQDPKCNKLCVLIQAIVSAFFFGGLFLGIWMMYRKIHYSFIIINFIIVAGVTYVMASLTLIYYYYSIKSKNRNHQINMQNASYSNQEIEMRDRLKGISNESISSARRKQRKLMNASTKKNPFTTSIDKKNSETSYTMDSVPKSRSIHENTYEEVKIKREETNDKITRTQQLLQQNATETRRNRRNTFRNKSLDGVPSHSQRKSFTRSHSQPRISRLQTNKKYLQMRANGSMKRNVPMYETATKRSLQERTSKNLYVNFSDATAKSEHIHQKLASEDYEAAFTGGYDCKSFIRKQNDICVTSKEPNIMAKYPIETYNRTTPYWQREYHYGHSYQAQMTPREINFETKLKKNASHPNVAINRRLKESSPNSIGQRPNCSYFPELHKAPEQTRVITATESVIISSDSNARLKR